jgi:hypothetical protein
MGRSAAEESSSETYAMSTALREDVLYVTSERAHSAATNRMSPKADQVMDTKPSVSVLVSMEVRSQYRLSRSRHSVRDFDGKIVPRTCLGKCG